MVVSVSPIVGLKHPPELAPTIPATVANVIAIVKAPRAPSAVDVVVGYFVCTITEMKMLVNIVYSKKTCHRGISSDLGFRMKGS